VTCYAAGVQPSWYNLGLCATVLFHSPRFFHGCNSDALMASSRSWYRKRDTQARGLTLILIVNVAPEHIKHV
jgi:hypothetical protein